MSKAILAFTLVLFVLFVLILTNSRKIFQFVSSLFDPSKKNTFQKIDKAHENLIIRLVYLVFDIIESLPFPRIVRKIILLSFFAAFGATAFLIIVVVVAAVLGLFFDKVLKIL